MADNKECSSCQSESCSAKDRQPNESDQAFQERQKISSRMCQIKHKVIVLSGKGGVGKSTVAVNLAYSLAARGKKVGLMDIDVHGPSVPRMLKLDKSQVLVENQSMIPIEYNENLKVISIGFFLRESDSAVIWRGPMKINLIKQFLGDVSWGELDYLIIDSPPGTGDEPLSAAQLIEGLSGAVIVTTPQDLALIDVRKSITFCSSVGLKVIGVIENMSGLLCPHCGKKIDLFKSEGGKKMAEDMRVPFLGSIPIDNAIVELSDEGIPFSFQHHESEAGKAIKEIVDKITGIENT